MLIKNNQKTKIDKEIRKGDQARDIKNWEDAILHYSAAVSLDSKLSHIWMQLGHAHKEAGNYSSAQEAYFKSIDLEPSAADSHLQMGHLLKITGDLKSAAQYYYKASLLDSDLLDAVRELSALELKGFLPNKDIKIISSDKTTTHAERAGNIVADTIDHVPISVVGRFNSDESSMGIHTSAFLQCLDPNIPIQCIETRPNELAPDTLAKLKNKNQNIMWASTPDDAKPSLISIFCDVVANGPDDNNYQKIPNSLIRYAYVAFDSTRLPNYWVSRLNSFDGVLVPDPCLIQTLKRSGIYRPVFCLPLALNFEHLNSSSASSSVKIEKTTDNRFIFGCIAGFGQRKNLRALITAFHETFANDDSVLLSIHSTLNFSNHYEELLNFVAELGSSNIELTCNVLSKSDYGDLLRSFDAYVQVSKGEGYSITPREAMYLGIPCLISENSAHKTIVDSELVVSVSTLSYEPARYEAMGDNEYGCQSVPDPAGIRAGLVRLLTRNRQMRAKSKEMRSFAETFSVDALRWNYRSVACPKDVFLGKQNVLRESYIETTDVSLYEKYQKIRHNRAIATNNVPVQKITIMGNDAGFFSVFNTFVSYLSWNIGRPEVISIIPDWRINSIMEYRNINKFTSFCYGKRGDGNLWLKFFEPIPGQNVAEASYNDPKYFEDAIIYDGYNEENEPNLTYIHAYKLYKSSGFKNWRRWYNHVVKKYVLFKEHITTQADVFEANNFDAELMIGCHVRHPSHGIEQPGSKLPTVDLFINHVIRRTQGVKNWKIYVATDQQSVIDRFVDVFGERVCYRSDVQRTSYAEDEVFTSLDARDQMKEGHQIQHITAAVEENWSTRMADEVIVDALLLSRCNTFIHITSNIATAVSFLNPDLEMIYCE